MLMLDSSSEEADAVGRVCSREGDQQTQARSEGVG